VLVVFGYERFRGRPVNVMNLDIVVKHPTWIVCKDSPDSGVGVTKHPVNPLFPSPASHFAKPALSIRFATGDDFDLAGLIVEFSDIDERHSAADRAAFGHRSPIPIPSRQPVDQRRLN
jgi:hypothetical protein